MIHSCRILSIKLGTCKWVSLSHHETLLEAHLLYFGQDNRDKNLSAVCCSFTTVLDLVSSCDAFTIFFGWLTLGPSFPPKMQIYNDTQLSNFEYKARNMQVGFIVTS